MFALVFLGVGLLAMAQSIPLASSQLTSSRNHTTATEAAQTTLERLSALDYSAAELTAGTHTEASGKQTITYTVQDDVPVPGTKRVDLVVTWPESKGTRTLNYTTLIHR
jgi:Tfp pilus assembly protein PilV